MPGASAAPPADDAKIEALITHVAQMKGAKFIRNGSEYDSASAAKFLRGKWDKQKAEVHNAPEFVEKIATKSSTSGKPYLIRFDNGKESPCGSYLTAELKKLEDKAPKKEP